MKESINKLSIIIPGIRIYEVALAITAELLKTVRKLDGKMVLEQFTAY